MRKGLTFEGVVEAWWFCSKCERPLGVHYVLISQRNCPDCNNVFVSGDWCSIPYGCLMIGDEKLRK